MKKENNDFKKKVLDGVQLAYKVTANSLYGQCGAKTSAFYERDVAASCTANGRKLLFYAKDVIEGCYNNIEIMVSDGTIVKTKADCIYGDTDSCFFKFNFVKVLRHDVHFSVRFFNPFLCIWKGENHHFKD